VDLLISILAISIPFLSDLLRNGASVIEANDKYKKLGLKA